MNIKDSGLFQQKCFVDGKWIGAKSGKTITVTNPADDSTLGTVPNMDSSDTLAAIEAAERAFPAWSGKTAKERSLILRRWFELLIEHKDDLAMIMTLEQGKPLAEAGGEILYAASFIEWFGEEAKRTYGDVIPQHQNDKRIVVIKQPVGVVGAITPWNFPSAMITRKAAPALAAGCTFVVKPSELTPYSAFALAELAKRAGVPDGVFNVITGDAAAIGETLTSSQIVKKITFTGSTAVGKLLMRQSADTVKKVSMELGGNAPLIIFDDADLDAAVEGAMISKYRNTGQTCVCSNRIYVQAGIYDTFVEKMSAAVGGLKVGKGTEAGVSQGPLINQKAVEKVERHIQDALSKGARLVTGGNRHALGGTYFEPTLIADATQDMLIAKEETFGPLAPIIKFETEDQAIKMANDTEFGLAAYFYARDMGRIWRVGEALQSGMVAINTGILSTEVAPFGGIKQSGIGREGSYMGIDEYLNVKYMLVAGI